MASHLSARSALLCDWLVVELAERGDAAIGPVLLGLVGRQLEHEHKVGRVPGGAQCAPARARLVRGTRVDVGARYLVQLLSLQNYYN